MCVNNLSKVALDSAAAEIEPAVSSRKSTTPPSHTTLRTSEDFRYASCVAGGPLGAPAILQSHPERQKIRHRSLFIADS